MKKIIILGVAIVTVLVGVYFGTRAILNKNLADENIKTVQAGEVLDTNSLESLTVFFPNIPDLEFVATKIDVKQNLSVEEKIKIIVEKLITGPTEDNQIDVMPDGTRLINVKVLDSIATLDFSKEFILNHPGGSEGEYTTIYSIVKSVTNLPQIDAVQILIEGSVYETYKGHYEIGSPIYPEEALN